MFSTHPGWLGRRFGGLGDGERRPASACWKVCLLSGVILASSTGSRGSLNSEYIKTSCLEVLPWAGRVMASSQVLVGSESLTSVGGTWKTADKSFPSLLWNVSIKSSLGLSVCRGSRSLSTAGEGVKQLSVRHPLIFKFNISYQ